ncbi:hypothetical protein C1752_17394 [Acaryochloris thomasi RCC1774]|uniref:Uncharacterized protein n=1 Tax=Acaryochloris thomasi RCC1774 TaxID=1764569 RepID=A0A2W1JIS3_9CYAN|nr:DUF4010 domain-containing protein [Acaryochloris thomasi]PZD70164.1 hypothetical protein C1752_17394 [Acaryochloris thomasi RCC1774]
MDNLNLQLTSQLIPSSVLKLLWVLFLSFLIGLEREEHRTETGRYAFGGVRTYPLIGLVGYSLAFLSNGQGLPLAVGFFAIASLMALSYWHKLQTSTEAGLTSEIASLATYLVGALVHLGHFWEASALVVSSLILLELKSALENLATRFSPEDILTFTQFLLLTIVILPILPNQDFGEFQINPFKTWLVVVAISTVSYASFLLQRVVKGKGGILLVALLGGAYSSTVTTIALAKHSVKTHSPHRYAGAILVAAGMMYLRAALLVSLFNPSLGKILVLPMGGLAIASVTGGGLWSMRSIAVQPSESAQRRKVQNPLELKAALAFAALFLVIVILTHYALQFLGQAGVYTLAGIMGIADVDPFIMGITQSASQLASLRVGATAILIATASNNVAKGLYVLSFGDRKTGKQSLVLLSTLSLLSIILTFFIR